MSASEIISSAGTYSSLPNRRVTAANGVEYADRDSAPDSAPGSAGDVPLIMLMHFRGNLDYWIRRWSTRLPGPAG
jgi:hypothetical protein